MKMLEDANAVLGDMEATLVTTAKLNISLAQSATHQSLIISRTVTSVLNVPLYTTDQETTHG
jgi:hypothetical protein